MDTEGLSELLQRFQTNQPSSADEIDAFEREAGFSIPSDYREFLYFTDGGEGFVGPNSYAMLWRVSELLRFNKEYQADVYAPGLFLLGSSGGGEAYAFDLRARGKSTVVSVPFIGMDLREALPLAETFDGFLEYLSQQ